MQFEWYIMASTVIIFYKLASIYQNMVELVKGICINSINVLSKIIKTNEQKKHASLFLCVFMSTYTQTGASRSLLKYDSHSSWPSLTQNPRNTCDNFWLVEISFRQTKSKMFLKKCDIAMTLSLADHCSFFGVLLIDTDHCRPGIH